MIQLEYKSPDPPVKKNAGAAIRFSFGVGLGFAMMAAFTLAQDDMPGCTLIGICIECIGAAVLFQIGQSILFKRSKVVPLERNRWLTFGIGMVVCAICIGAAFLVHFCMSEFEQALPLIFVGCGILMSVSSPWLAFRRASFEEPELDPSGTLPLDRF